MGIHSKYPKGAGIYKFICENGKVYIGKSINLRIRLADHKSTSKNRKVGRCYFENALIKYGWDSFTVEILETFENFDKTKLEDRLMILDRETYYIKFFDSDNKTIGYNICRYSMDRTGITCSEESREKMRQAKLGKPRSEETKEKMRQAKLGKPRSEETKEKMRQATLGRVVSNETKEKLSKSSLGNPKSEEHRNNMRKANLGKILTEEHKEKIRLGNLGKKQSEETKEKIRNTLLKRS